MTGKNLPVSKTAEFARLQAMNETFQTGKMIMGEKTAYLISCSDHYGHRLNVADKCLREKGYRTTYITSNFDHTKKEIFTCLVPDAVQIPARAYKKNLSVSRILSHWEFARDVFSYIEKQAQQPDIIVVLLPPNFLAHYAAKYKKRHPNVKLIFDVFDLWPETFPFGKLKKVLAPIFSVWAWLRDHNLGIADFVTTECELFRKRLMLPEENSATVYLCADPLKVEPALVVLRDDALDLCYLGAINNIIDIPAICELIAKLVKEKPVTLHIIGKGEREKEFIDSAKAAGASVKFYGPVFNDVKKLEIMNRCHFGLNIMKPSVCIGLTMKSVDYFRFGVPIINNIPVDTRRFVEEQDVGIQLDNLSGDHLSDMNNRKIQEMRDNASELFKKSFSVEVVLKQYSEILDMVIAK